VQPGASC